MSAAPASAPAIIRAAVYSFDESAEPDPELKKFSIDHDKAYILPMLREARKANPELFLFSSPWSSAGMDEGQRLHAGRSHAQA